MSQANELEDRLIDCAVRIIKLANALPDSPAAKTAKQKSAARREESHFSMPNDN